MENTFIHKKKISFGIYGEFQSGKSTLAGKIFLKNYTRKVKEIDDKIDEAQQRGCEYYKSVCDVTKLERLREISIESKNLNFENENSFVSMIDIPGNPRLVKNIIRGLCLLECGIFVVSSDFSVNNQNEVKNLNEILLISFATGIRKIVVAVNKMEICHFSLSKFESIKNKLLSEMITIGFEENQIDFIPISCVNDDNLFELSQNTPWYEGKSLIDLIENFELNNKKLSEESLRLIVIDFFHKTNVGTIFTTKLASGVLKIGDDLYHPKYPSRSFRIKSIQSNFQEFKEISADDGPIEYSINLNKIDLRRGDVFCKMVDNSLPKYVKDFVAKLKFNCYVNIKTAVSNSKLHVHSAFSECKFSEIIEESEELNDKIKNEKTVKFYKDQTVLIRLTPFSTRNNQIISNSKIYLETFDSPNKALGTIILRDKGVTLAIGKVESINYL